MKMKYWILAFVLIFMVLSGCENGNNALQETTDNTTDTTDTTLETESLSFLFTDGVEHSGYNKVYAIWMEDGAGFFKNLFVCNHIFLQDLTGTAMPYWQVNKRSKNTEAQLDALSAATISTGNISLDIALEDAPQAFTIYFEVDHSFDGNDWFSDQPALLYGINVDRSNGSAEFEGKLLGWTPNENTNHSDDSRVLFSGLDTEMGELQSETRFITHQNDGSGGFGELDDAPASDLVGGLTASYRVE